jgi:nicotinate (nicotinamide) nucleotide adenylyltransferase
MKSKRIALYGGSFNPPGNHHHFIAGLLLLQFDEVVIVPCGSRNDKESNGVVTHQERKQMIELAFQDITGLRFDWHDLDNGVFTPTHELQERYNGDDEIWHVVGADIIIKGRTDQSKIQTSWKNGQEVWQNLNFCVLPRPGYNLSGEDLPPHCLEIDCHYPGSSSQIREKIAMGLPIDDLVPETVAEYITENQLYYDLEHLPRGQSQLAWKGFFEVKTRQTDGGARDVVRTTDSVSLLILLKDLQEIILVRQPRVSMITDDNPDGMITELVAGRFDVDLTVKQLAAKEASEEVGATIDPDRITLINDGQSMALSAGILDEMGYLTFVTINSSEIEATDRIFGVEDEGEQIQRVRMPISDLANYVCEDVRTFALIQWFLRTQAA